MGENKITTNFFYEANLRECKSTKIEVVFSCFNTDHVTIFEEPISFKNYTHFYLCVQAP